MKSGAIVMQVTSKIAITLCVEIIDKMNSNVKKNPAYSPKMILLC